MKKQDVSGLFTGIAMVLAVIYMSIIMTKNAMGADAPWGDCKTAIALAEQNHGLPQGLLMAIARTESGKWSKVTGRAEPHAWAINNAGNNYYPKTWQESYAIINKLRKRGETNIDIGCMQINWRWHVQEFDNIKHMMDAYASADYAARFLARLKQRHKTWKKAIACYHNCKEEHKQARYLNAVLGNIW